MVPSHIVVCWRLVAFHTTPTAYPCMHTLAPVRDRGTCHTDHKQPQHAPIQSTLRPHFVKRLDVGKTRRARPSCCYAAMACIMRSVGWWPYALAGTACEGYVSRSFVFAALAWGSVANFRHHCCIQTLHHKSGPSVALVDGVISCHHRILGSHG